MNILFLVGMPGVGKTWWGRKIADHYRLNFFDTDDIIEKNTDLSIVQIFEQYGEDYFRKIESEVLQNILNENIGPAIIACGGGTPLRGNNLSLMKDAGCVIFLDAGIDTLLNNLASEKNSRPLLSQATNPIETLQTLLEERKKVYEQAHYILQAENISITTFEEIIHSCTDRH